MLLANPVREPTCQSDLDLLGKPGRFGLALGHRETRHQIPVRKLRFTPLSDQQGVVAGLRKILENMTHLGRRLEIELFRFKLEALGVVERGGGLNAQQSRVSIGIVRVGVVQVVCGHERQAEVGSQAEQIGRHAPFDVETVIHYLDIKVLRTEDVTKLSGGFSRGVVLAEAQARLNFSTGTSCGGDESAGIPTQELTVHARLEVKTLQRRERRELEEVVHALGGRRQECHVRVRTAA